MSDRTPIRMATIGNLAVTAVTLVLGGWAAGGAHAAARNTARFSALWFMAGLAAPGLGRWVRGMPAEARMIQAFVAAHLVHFATVAALLLAFEAAHLRHHPAQAAATVLGGFALVAAMGLMASPQASRLHTIFRRLLLSVIFFIFLVAFLRDVFKPLRVLAVGLVLALMVRLSGSWTFFSATVKARE
jgi:hypothetical protein